MRLLLDVKNDLSIKLDSFDLVSDIIDSIKNKGYKSLYCFDNVIEYRDAGLSILLNRNLKEIQDELNYNLNMLKIKDTSDFGKQMLDYYIVFDSYFKLSNNKIIIIIQNISGFDYILSGNSFQNDYEEFDTLKTLNKKYSKGEFDSLTNEEIYEEIYGGERERNWRTYLSAFEEEGAVVPNNLKMDLIRGVVDLSEGLTQYAKNLFGIVLDLPIVDDIKSVKIEDIKNNLSLDVNVNKVKDTVNVNIDKIANSYSPDDFIEAEYKGIDNPMEYSIRSSIVNQRNKIPVDVTNDLLYVRNED